jgi:cytochrome oxidase assembly protein ShyY1
MRPTERRTVGYVLRTLFQPRYAALSALMVIVAGICLGAGIWQVARLSQKITDNAALRDNAHAAAAPIGSVLPILAVGNPGPREDSVEFRTITASGTYSTVGQVLVRQRSVNGVSGYLVLTPLRTSDATLLVVRGFIGTADTAGGAPAIPAPPDGLVDIRGRVQRGETRADEFVTLNNGQVESINVVQQQARLGTQLYDGFVQLGVGQPGTSAITAIPDPDLSNPAGGAVEPQHIAYVIQWFLFAGLALAAPIVMARAETHRSPTHDELSDGLSEDLDGRTDDTGTDQSDDHDRFVEAKLTARYGRTGRRMR